MALALYYKKKRMEIIVFLSFIFGFLLFFSSEYVSNIAMTDRFMLPVLPLTFSLIGFLILGVWKEFHKKISSDRKRSIMIFKICFLIIITIFFIFSFIYFSPVQKILKDDFAFKDPVVFANKYPLDMEGLTEKSIVVNRRGMKAVDYNVTPYTMRGVLLHDKGLYIAPKTQEKLFTLKQIISEDHDVFTFKKHIYEMEPLYFRYIESNQDIILKNYSKTFCKLELIEDSNESAQKEISKSDDLCYMWEGKVIP